MSDDGKALLERVGKAKAISGGPKGSLYTQRKEDKYILPLSCFDRVISAVEDRLYKNYPNRGTKYTVQESVYLETPKLDFLINHLKDLGTRYKMRMRYYAPNNEWAPEEYLEVKYRDQGDQKKLRVAIDTAALACVTGGKALPPDVKDLNEDMESSDYDKAAAVINKLSKDNELTPICSIEYKRLSYINKQGNIRLTIDRGVKVSPRRKDLSINPIPNDLLGLLNEYDTKFNPSSDFIVEIKYEDGTQPPDWFTNLISQENSSSEGFSKYAYSLSQLLK